MELVQHLVCASFFCILYITTKETSDKSLELATGISLELMLKHYTTVRKGSIKSSFRSMWLIKLYECLGGKHFGVML